MSIKIKCSNCHYAGAELHEESTGNGPNLYGEGPAIKYWYQTSCDACGTIITETIECMPFKDVLANRERLGLSIIDEDSALFQYPFSPIPGA